MTATNNMPDGEMPKLSAALVKAQAAMKNVGKSGHNKFDNYKYATLEDFVHAVRPVLEKNELSVICSVSDVERLPDRTTANGKTERVVQVKCIISVSHSSGEHVALSCFGEGQDRADKAIYKAITGCRKYALACLFNLATSDDPEADPTTGAGQPGSKKPAAKLPDKPPANADVNQAKKELLGLLTAARKGGNSSLSDTAVIKFVIKDVLGKATADTLEDVARVRAAILVNKDYDLDTAERIPGDAKV